MYPVDYKLQTNLTILIYNWLPKLHIS